MSPLNRRLPAFLIAFLICIAASAATVETPPAHYGDWPQWRGPNRDSVSTETGLQADWLKSPPPLEWTAKDLGDGYSSISTQNGRIFTMGQHGDDQFVIALKQDDGKEIWSTKIGKGGGNGGYPGPRCVPAADGQFVYALGSEGDLACLDAAHGHIKWALNFKKDFGGRMMSGWGYSESPLVDGDRLICTPGGKDAAIVALDKLTGKTIWKCALPEAEKKEADDAAKSKKDAGDDAAKGKKGHGGRGNRGGQTGEGAGYASIVIGNGGGVRQYVQLMGRGLVGVRAEDGKFLWSYSRMANGTANIATPIVRGDYVFDSTSYDGGAALIKLSPTDDGGVKADEVYYLPAKKVQNHHGGMVLVGDYVYGGHGRQAGAPFCIEFLTGKEMWKKDHGPGTGSAAVAAADGKLYFRYENGTMALLDCTPDGYKELGTFQIPDVSKPSWPHPVIVGGRLYLREQDRLLCYKLK